MPFSTKVQHFSTTDVVVASAPRTVTGASAALVGYGPAKVLRAQLDVTAAAGTTPTLNVVLEDSLDGVNFNPIATFAQRVAAGREVLNIAVPFANTLRVSWTITGSAGQSFTFSVVLFAEV